MRIYSAVLIHASHSLCQYEVSKSATPSIHSNSEWVLKSQIDMNGKCTRKQSKQKQNSTTRMHKFNTKNITVCVQHDRYNNLMSMNVVRIESEPLQ